MTGYNPWTLASLQDEARQEFNRPTNEVTISRDDYDHVITLLRTGSTYINRNLMEENATIHISMAKALQVLEQYK